MTTDGINGNQAMLQRRFEPAADVGVAAGRLIERRREDDWAATPGYRSPPTVVGKNTMEGPVVAAPRIAALDGVRGYAAIVVVIYHAILDFDLSQVYDPLRIPAQDIGTWYGVWAKIWLVDRL